MQQPIKRTEKQKLLIMLPVFLIGIAGLIFAGINIMKKVPNATPLKETKSALNTQLPPPNLPVKQKNKLETYMEAAKDSVKRHAEWEKDPNSKRFYDPAPSAKSIAVKKIPTKPSLPQATNQEDMDPNLRKVNERLQKLYAALNQSDKAGRTDKNPSTAAFDPAKSEAAPSVETERLEKLLQNARHPDTATDPNLDRVEKMLDKVLDIQHPDRVVAKTEAIQTANQPAVFRVTTMPADAVESDGQDMDQEGAGPNAFYGLEQEPQPDSSVNANTIQAVVPEDQTLQNGSTIKLRLMQDIFIGSRRIPANNFIYGTCTVTNQRLQIQLTSAQANNEIFPISLKVYDMDGLEGIFVPGAVTRDVTKEGISQGISGMGITSLDPSLGAQAAAAGIETAKNLLSKKVKAVIVTIRAGHRVLLQPTRTIR